jgi:O-antigen/teichoic acid export membrane protein
MIRHGSLARNVLSNWIVLASNVAFAFVITPVIVRALGAERYGVWSFLNGLVAYSELLYLGLGSALVKQVAQYRVADDQSGINRLASVVASIYSTLGFACLAVLVALSPFVPRMFAEQLSPSAAQGARITCMLLGVRLLMIFIGSVFSGVLSGYNRYDLANGVYLFSVVVRFIATPLLLTRGFDPLLTLAWLTTVSVALDLAVLMFLSLGLVRRLRIRPTIPKRSELQWLYGFGLQSFFILFAVKLISYTDTTVIGFTLGAASVALYALPLQLVEYARLFVGGFAGVFLPKVAFMSAQGDVDSLRDAYLRSARIACFLAGWLGGLLIMLGPSFLSRWVGADFGGPVSHVLLFLVLAMFGQVLASQVPLAFYQALHLLAAPAVVLMVEAALNLVLSLWLAPWLGLNGVALATLIPSVISVIVLPPYLCRRIGVPLKALVASGIAPGAFMFAGTVATQFVGAYLFPSGSWAALAARAALSAPISIAVVGWMFPEEERRVAARLLRLPSMRRFDSGAVR